MNVGSVLALALGVVAFAVGVAVYFIISTDPKPPRVDGAPRATHPAPHRSTPEDTL